MDINSKASQLELGRYLTIIRERAGIKQVDLAKKITLSPAVLSRIETGERGLASEELENILKAIGTPEATHLLEALEREWSILPRPLLDHPDQDLLWEAEKVAKKLAELRVRPDVRHAFERRLTEYIGELEQLAENILKRDHQIAFIGSIGIGKSTAICRLTGLEVLGTDGVTLSPVLEAGAGGVTICEVHLSTGPGYGLMIEPRSDDEIRADVMDFAEHISKVDAEDAKGLDNDSQGISKEFERAIRNMAKLKIRREKGSDGKIIRHDEAKEFAQKFTSLRELVVEVLARMELHRRDRRDVWFDSNTGKAPLVWLKDIFELVNNGRHPDFTLPKRIEVVVPQALLGGLDLSIRIIDTKGIDRTAARADLELHLDDSHTLAILCSSFNNAPSAESRLLLERAKEAGVSTLHLNAAILALPRPNEALAVKDESGIRVETIAEGYELKGEQVSMALEPLGLQQLPVGFYNAYQDDQERLKSFLAKCIEQIREAFRARIRETTINANSLLINQEKEQVQEVLRAAAKMLKSWVEQNLSITLSTANIQDSLIDQMAQVYASTIRATVRREGEWPNLNYLHHLGYGARRLAALSLDNTVKGFSETCKVMLGNSDYAEATDLIRQAERLLNTSYEKLLREVQLMGQTSFSKDLKTDTEFWQKCDSEWGRGSGYRDRITNINEIWFNNEKRQELEKELRRLIERKWSQVLQRVATLFENEE